MIAAKKKVDTNSTGYEADFIRALAAGIREKNPELPAQMTEMKAASMLDRPEDWGWRRLTGDINRDLLPMSQDRMIEIAYWLWETNPMAGWLIEITVAFILAEGLPYEAKNENVKAALDSFWFDPVNRMDLSFGKNVRELFVFGELCLPAFVAEQTGQVRLGYIDPARILEVVTDPENVRLIIGVVTKDSSQSVGKKYQTILPEGSDYVMSQKAKDLRNSYTDGQCFYFSINNVTNSPRGRSELLRVADWVDAYEQFLYDYADKWPLLNTFVWDMTVEGGDDIAIKKQMTNFTKKSGSVFGHNEKVKLLPSTPDLKSVEASEGARLFRNHILGSLSYPEHWFGGGGNVNRATATEMDTPTYKALATKQRYVKYILESIFDFVIKCGRDARYLRITDQDAKSYSTITPELAQKNIAVNATAIQNVTTALMGAQTGEWIDTDTARQIFASMMEYLGIEIDVDAIKEALLTEQETKAYRDYPKGQPGGTDGGQNAK